MGDLENRKAIQMRIFELENLLVLVEKMLTSKTSRELNKAIEEIQDKVADLEEIPMPGQRKQN